MSSFFKQASTFVVGPKKVDYVLDSKNVLTQIPSASVPQETFNKWNQNLQKPNSFYQSYVQDCLKMTNLHKKRENGQTAALVDFVTDFAIIGDKDLGLIFSSQENFYMYWGFMWHPAFRFVPLCIGIQNFVDLSEEEEDELVECENNWHMHHTLPSHVGHVYDVFTINHKDQVTQDNITTVYTIMEYCHAGLAYVLDAPLNPIVPAKQLFSFYVQILMSIAQFEEAHNDLYIRNLLVKQVVPEAGSYLLRADGMSFTEIKIPPTALNIVIPSAQSCGVLIKNKTPSTQFQNLGQLTSVHISDLVGLGNFGRDILLVAQQFYQYVLARSTETGYGELAQYFNTVLQMYVQKYNQGNSFTYKWELRQFIYDILQYNIVGQALLAHIDYEISVEQRQ